MVRFIDIGDQIYCDGESREFSFYNTITDEYVVIGGRQVFDSWDDVQESLRYQDGNHSWPSGGTLRLRELCPEWVFGGFTK